ncbi:MAG: putative DNA binding domain-containing protein [Methanomassiliicoccaceae archaeon]|nr:putative DNA binding domain-containing protein [Methanomassiliicoccaceae archaeon]
MEMQLTETENTEYKRRITEDIERTVIGYLNTSGGELRIGIDPDGSVYGLDNYDEEARKFTDKVKNNISPSALGLFSVSPRMGNNGKAYLIITIAGGSEKPYYLKEFGMSPKGCFMRVGTQTMSMPQDMIETLFVRRSLHTLHNTSSPNQFLKFEQLKIYYNEMGFTVDNDNFLRSLGLYNDDGKFNYLAYLLADSNAVSVKIAQYAGTDKITLLHKTECGQCSLIKATKCMLSALDMYNKTGIEISSTRKDTPMVDRIALREALMNAILHNDYVRGAYPVVEFFSDRVEVTSSGGLPLGLTKEDFFGGVSHPRNHELMRIFKDMDLCEQLGSGMRKIMEKYKPEDYRISENFVRASFKYNEHALEVLKGLWPTQTGTIVTKLPDNLSPLDIAVYKAIAEGKYTNTEDMATSSGSSVRSVKSAISKLKDENLIRRKGSDKKGFWELIFK